MFVSRFDFTETINTVCWMQDREFTVLAASISRRVELVYKIWMETQLVRHMELYLESENYNQNLHAIRKLENWSRDGDFLTVKLFESSYTWKIFGLNNRFPELRAPWQLKAASDVQTPNSGK